MLAAGAWVYEMEQSLWTVATCEAAVLALIAFIAWGRLPERRRRGEQKREGGGGGVV